VHDVDEPLGDADAPLDLTARMPSDVLIVIDDQGRVVSDSPSIEAILGYSPSEFIRRSPVDLIHPDERADAAEEYRRLQTGVAGELTAELRMQHASGEWCWVELLATNAIDHHVGAAVINFRDISDRKEAEQALRRSEERFRALAQNSFDVMMIMAPDGNVAYASPSVERTFGYRPEELVGTPGLDFLHPDDLEGAIERLATLLATPDAVQTSEMPRR
jgi:PAS domain S-box-containing protein